MTIDYTVTQPCPNTCVLSVSSSEPINGIGDGNTSPDWQVIDAHHVLLRAERSGPGNGRLYRVNITCTNDLNQETSSKSVLILVPHDQSPFNRIDDPLFFVHQHYGDFLNRFPDPGGFTFWSGQFTGCDNDPLCIFDKRVDVSNSFFYELEFQQTGAYVYRLYRASFGNSQPFPNPDSSNQAEANKIPSYSKFKADRQQVIGGSNLAQLQLALATNFVGRTEFTNKYDPGLSPGQFVDAILGTIQNDLGVDLTSQKSALVNLSRDQVLYRLANDDLLGGNGGINNRPLIDAEYNRAFVYTQYAGYLGRDGDIGGLMFWLGQVNSGPLRDVSKQHAMVCSFITSAEYQLRFGNSVTHHNSECPH